jgi:hypothetical protein
MRRGPGCGVPVRARSCAHGILPKHVRRDGTLVCYLRRLLGSARPRSPNAPRQAPTTSLTPCEGTSRAASTACGGACAALQRDGVPIRPALTCVGRLEKLALSGPSGRAGSGRSFCAPMLAHSLQTKGADERGYDDRGLRHCRFGHLRRLRLRSHARRERHLQDQDFLRPRREYGQERPQQLQREIHLHRDRE